MGGWVNYDDKGDGGLMARIVVKNVHDGLLSIGGRLIERGDFASFAIDDEEWRGEKIGFGLGNQLKSLVKSGVLLLVKEEYGDIGGGSKPVGAVTIASYDTVNKAGADFVCDGVDDIDEFARAVEYLKQVGGKFLYILNGTYGLHSGQRLRIRGFNEIYIYGFENNLSITFEFSSCRFVKLHDLRAENVIIDNFVEFVAENCTLRSVLVSYGKKVRLSGCRVVDGGIIWNTCEAIETIDVLFSGGGWIYSTERSGLREWISINVRCEGYLGFYPMGTYDDYIKFVALIGVTAIDSEWFGCDYSDNVLIIGSSIGGKVVEFFNVKNFSMTNSFIDIHGEMRLSNIGHGMIQSCVFKNRSVYWPQDYMLSVSGSSEVYFANTFIYTDESMRIYKTVSYPTVALLDGLYVGDNFDAVVSLITGGGVYLGAGDWAFYSHDKILLLRRDVGAETVEAYGYKFESPSEVRTVFLIDDRAKCFSQGIKVMGNYEKLSKGGELLSNIPQNLIMLVDEMGNNWKVYVGRDGILRTEKTI